MARDPPCGGLMAGSSSVSPGYEPTARASRWAFMVRLDACVPIASVLPLPGGPAPAARSQIQPRQGRYFGPVLVPARGWGSRRLPAPVRQCRRNLLMRGPLASVAVFALVCGWTVVARAQSSPSPPSAPSGQAPAGVQGPPSLNVNRGADAQDCPDAVRLAGDIEAIRGPRTAAATTGYSVAFARSGQTLSATIRSGPAGASVRLLEARGQTCAALAHAVAVTLSLLFDSDKVDSADAKPDEVK